MRATGIIRRIDDLGRVVIPREIRRDFGIKSGDALEIYTGYDGEVTFKKYIPNALVDKAPIWQKILLARIGCKCTIYDTGGFVLASNERLVLDTRVDIDDTKNEYNVFPIVDECDCVTGYLQIWGYDEQIPSHFATAQTILALIREII